MKNKNNSSNNCRATANKCRINTVTHLKNGDNDTKQADSTAKDFNDQNSHEQSRILCISERCTRANDANTDATEQVGKADRQTSTKHGVT